MNASLLKIKKIFKGEVDLSSPKLFRNLIVFSLPIILLSLLQLVYTEADQLIVDYFGGGYTSFVAVSSNTSLINLLVGFFFGLSVGANVVISKAKGADNQAKAERALHMSLLIAIVSGIITAIGGYFAAPNILKIMNVAPEVIDKASLYLRIYFLGTPFLMIFNFGSSILRSLGDSKKPFLILLSCAGVNVGLNFLFVLAFNMDVLGVGLATIICEAVQAFLTILILAKAKNSYVKLKLSKLFKISWEEIKDILVAGIPAGLQSLAFTISNVFIQSSVNSFGLAVTAGNQASLQIEAFIYLILNGFSVAVVSLTATNVGAKNERNVRKILLYSLLTVFTIGIVLGGVFAIFREQLINIFISEEVCSSPEILEKAVEIGKARLLLIGLTYPLCGLMDTEAAYCRSLGHSFVPTIITVSGVSLLRLLFVFALFNNIPYFHKIEWIWIIWAGTWLITDILYWMVIPKYQKEVLSKMRNDYLDQDKIKEVKDGFVSIFKKKATSYFFSNGRLEILGNHTDHQGGLSLVGGCSLGIYASTRKNKKNSINIVSKGYEDIHLDILNLDKDELEKGSSLSLVKGVLSFLKEKGYLLGGFDAYLVSDIPSGAGVSSSAAYELLIAEIISSLFNKSKISKIDKALSGKYAENNYFGKPCGLLDQIGASFGGLSLVDFHNEVPIIKELSIDSLSSLNIYLVNPGSTHEGLVKEYASIPEDMFKVAKEVFNKDRLSDVDEDLSKLDSSTLDSLLISRAKHYFAEIERVKKAYLALENKDLESFILLQKETYFSQKELLKNTMIPGKYLSSPEEASEKALSLLAKGSARVMGGGFGGTIICFLFEEEKENFVKEMSLRYGKENVIKVSLTNLGAHKL